MNEEIIYKPSTWQQKFHDLGPEIHEALGAGSAGPGKSLCLLMDPNEQIQTEHNRCSDPSHPHPLKWGQSVGKCLHLRRTRPELDETIARSQRLFRAIDPGAHYSGANTTWTFSSGYKYQFGHCRDPDSWTNYYSQEFTYIAFDELTTFTKVQYDQITSRLRSSDPVLRHMLKVRSCTNPVQPASSMVGVQVDDPLWVRKHFVDPAPQGDVVLKRKIVNRDGKVMYRRRIFLRATLYDNPDPDFIAQYEQNLLGKPDHMVRALLYGDWYVTEGAYYGDIWDESIHVCEPFRIPDDWPVFRSMDWGFKQPGTIGWWAIDPDGNMFCFREYNFQGKVDEYVAKQVQRIEKEETERGLRLWANGRSCITGPADTQLWEKRGDSAKSKAEVFADHGVQWGKADKSPGSRASHAQLVYKRLVDHHDRQATPGMVFFNSCTKCITTLPSVHTNPTNPEEPADGGEDHWHDMIRYAAAWASKKGHIGRRRARDPWDDDGNGGTPDRGNDGYGGVA